MMKFIAVKSIHEEEFKKALINNDVYKINNFIKCGKAVISDVKLLNQCK